VVGHVAPALDRHDVDPPAAKLLLAGAEALRVAGAADGQNGIVLDDVERQLIVEALRASGANRTQAAKLLGISRDTLRYRLEKYHLQGDVAAG